MMQFAEAIKKSK